MRRSSARTGTMLTRSRHSGRSEPGRWPAGTSRTQRPGAADWSLVVPRRSFSTCAGAIAPVSSVANAAPSPSATRVTWPDWSASSTDTAATPSSARSRSATAASASSSSRSPTRRTTSYRTTASRSRWRASRARWRWSAASWPVTSAVSRNSSSETHSPGSDTVSSWTGGTKNQSNVTNATTDANTAGPRP